MFVCLSYRNLKDKFSIFSLEFPFFGKLLLIFADYTLYMYMLIRLKKIEGLVCPYGVNYFKFLVDCFLIEVVGLARFL